MNKRKYFFLSQKKYKSYALCEREIVFQIFFFGKQLIENKPYFYKSFPLTKDSFPLTKFFFYITKHWKMWKTIFIEGFPTKQTEHLFRCF